MKCRVVITTDGKVRVFTDEGTLAEGTDVINQVFAAMLAQGIELTDISPVEQHRHDIEGAHTHVHADGTTHTH